MSVVVTSDLKLSEQRARGFFARRGMFLSKSRSPYGFSCVNNLRYIVGWDNTVKDSGDDLSELIERWRDAWTPRVVR